MSDAENLPSRPPASARAVLGVLARLPQGALSRAFGRVADVPLPPALRRPVLGTFARLVGADVDEAERPLEEYASLNRFFVRRLREGVRTWPEWLDAVGSPVDGRFGQVGRVTTGRLIQAKGREYSLRDLLDGDEAWERFEGGAFATLYLSPKDYHRIHAPTDGVIRHARHIPGALLPVNLPAVAHVPELFARNERLLCYLEGPVGRIAVVAVGAYNVGRISAAFDPAWSAAAGADAWVTNRAGAAAESRSYDPPVRVHRGEEIMAFHLGSTVVLVFEPGRVELAPDVAPEKPVRLGQMIARAVGADNGASGEGSTASNRI